MFNILIVDDNETIKKLIITYLKREGYSIFTASDGIEALEVLEKEHVDLMVADIMMPNMDGYTLTENLRSSKYNFPILIITAKERIEDKKKGFLVGADDYMVKPIDFEEMLLRISALLRRAKISNDRKIVIGDIVVDYDTLTLTTKTESILLPQKEFLLLFKLLSYPKKIFTRHDLMDEIWGLDTETDEVGKFATEFNTMVKELKSIDTLRRDFVSNISHEFRTPITSIKGFAALIRDSGLTDEQRFEYSDIIVSESERLIGLSSNLLRLSELDSQSIREKSSVFSLDEQIRKTILILEPQWAKKNIDFEIDLQETEYFGEEDLLWEVWLNIIQNAIKFSNDDGKIRISLYIQDDTLKVEIADNGIGIKDEDKEWVFERFYKGDKSRSKDGNGLGLVIAKKIVEISGGRIYFQSEEGKGTVFTVELKKNNSC